MKDFHHENVMELLAVTLHDEKPQIVLPFMCHGDLHNYLKDKDQVWGFVLHVNWKVDTLYNALSQS